MQIVREIHNRSKCREYGIMECLTLNDISVMQPIHPRLRKKSQKGRQKDYKSQRPRASAFRYCSLYVTGKMYTGTCNNMVAWMILA